MPDIERIIRMSELWNVSTDYLLKESSGEEQADGAGGRPQEEQAEREPADGPWDNSGGGGSGTSFDTAAGGAANAFGDGADFGTSGAGQFASGPSIREISRAEAIDFLEVSRHASPRMAFGVMLCILSPVCLFLLGALSESPALFGGAMFVSENLAAGIGLSVLLVLVAVAVGIFITTGMQLSAYEYMEKEEFVVPEDVLMEVAARQADYESTFRGSITVGVILCVTGAIPLFLSTAFFDEDFAMSVGLCILLVLVAVGVFFLVSAGIIHGSHEKLMQTGDYAPEKKRANKKIGVIAGIFWCGIVSVYLLMSFITFRWDRTWIIFPVAGVLFGGISALIHGISR